MTHFNLQQLKEMREGITKGEWQHMNEDNLDVKTYVFAPSGVIAASVTNADAELIASAPSILSDLIEALESKEELKKRIEWMKQPDGKVRLVAGTLTNISGNTFYNSALSDVLSMLDGEK